MNERARVLVAIIAIIAIVVSAAIVVSVIKLGTGSTTSQEEKFLIIASVTGFNDSVSHGVPQNPWPVIHVAKGTMVNITVTNVDHQAHGFQITHYYDGSIYTIAPGQSIQITFVANVSGTFKIYCSIFCTVHWAMQSGELVVS